MVLPIAVWTSGSLAVAGPQSVQTLREGMLLTANAAGSPSPAVLLHTPEGLGAVAPPGFRVVSPDGELSRSLSQATQGEAPKGLFNLTLGIPSIVIRVVRTPPDDGDAQVS